MTDPSSIGPVDSAGGIEAHAPITAGPQARPAPPAPVRPDTTSPGTPNPTLVLDPALGLVVLQFNAGGGDATVSIPSQQQLDAYRSGAAALPGHSDKANRSA